MLRTNLQFSWSDKPQRSNEHWFENTVGKLLRAIPECTNELHEVDLVPLTNDLIPTTEYTVCATVESVDPLVVFALIEELACYWDVELFDVLVDGDQLC